MSSVTLLPHNKQLLIATEQEGTIRLNHKPLDKSSLNSFSNQQQSWKGKHPSMATDPNGNVLLTWAEGAGWAKGGTLRWVIMNKSGKVVAKSPSENQLEIPVWSFPSALHLQAEFQVIY